VIKDYVATEKGLRFIDLWDAMLTADGKPREDLGWRTASTPITRATSCA
jgi:hypothetical protein